MVSARYIVAAVVAPFLVSAAAKPPKETCTQTICIDAVNECGIRYGGCVPACTRPLPPLSKPPCPTTTAPPHNHVAKAQANPTSTRKCPIVCIDGVNSCGMGFGTCVPHCMDQPWPKLTPPPCPATVTPPPNSNEVGKRAQKKDDDDCLSICIDAINSCGIRFGTCGPVCNGKFPSLSTPPCPSATQAHFLHHEGKRTLVRIDAKATPTLA